MVNAAKRHAPELVRLLTKIDLNLTARLAAMMNFGRQ